MFITFRFYVWFRAHSINRLTFNKGMSLIEILVSVSIIAILVTFSVQSIHKYKENQVLRSIAQQYYFAMTKALNRSLLNSESLILTTLHHQKDSINNELIGQQTFTKPAWHYGLSLFQYDSNKTINNQEYTSNTLIYSYQNNHLFDNISIDLKSSLNRPYLIFYETGALWPNGRFIFCHKDYQSGYEIIFSQWGNIQFLKSKNACI